MIKFATILIAAAAFSAPAFAQDTNITLRVDSGSAMASTGGEYMSANTGKPLVAGEKLMVNAGSSITVVYENGCSRTYDAPGVYEVSSQCTKGGWTNGDHANGMNAAIIIGTGVIGAALLNSENNTGVGPLSAGIRHL